MKKVSALLALTLAALLLMGGGQLHAQSYDKELTELATAVSKSLKENERKKATVLDFMDLQGNTSELGRFIAEQFSVALVMSRTGFSVMDRANLKTILAEHKLTISGLVEPENAKKLGQFSGVDAIILGNITALKDDIVVTVKVIATDTAEILGAAKARIPKSKDLEALITNTITSGTPDKPEGGAKPAGQAGPQSDLVKQLQIDKNSSHAGDLFIRVESVRQVTAGSRDSLVVTLAFVNTNTTSPIFCKLASRDDTFAALTDSKGQQVQIRDYNSVTGIFATEYTEVESARSIKVEFPFDLGAGSYRIPLKHSASSSYRLQFGIAVGSDSNVNRDSNKRYNVLIDIEGDK